MASLKPQRRIKDPTAGGKRAAMGPEDEPVTEELGGEAQSLGRGIEAISAAVKTLPNGPGVYRMLDRRGKALYVGKARNLKKRVTTYTQISKLPYRLQRMVAETALLEVVTTHSEVEALLLESNLIKRLMPRYNVLLRDDKSFPYILITGDNEVPQITKHRGAHTGPASTSGPSPRPVRSTGRSPRWRRPSCCAPARMPSTRQPEPALPDVPDQALRGALRRPHRARRLRSAGRQAKDFLTGRNRDVQTRLAEEMQAASERLDFESAARLSATGSARCRTSSRTRTSTYPGSTTPTSSPHMQDAGRTCVQVLLLPRRPQLRQPGLLSQVHDRKTGRLEAVLRSFVAQFYDNKPTPPLVLLSHAPDDRLLLAEALSQRAGSQVSSLLVPQRGGQAQADRARLEQRPRRAGPAPSESASQRSCWKTWPKPSRLGECAGADRGL